MQDIQIVSDTFPLSDCEEVVAKLLSENKSGGKGTDTGLHRSKFLEALIFIASLKFKSVAPADALRLFGALHLVPFAARIDADSMRHEKLLMTDVLHQISIHLTELEELFEKYSTSRNTEGETTMKISDFQTLMDDSKLLMHEGATSASASNYNIGLSFHDISVASIRRVFVMSKRLMIDDLQLQAQSELTLVEFVEALARIVDFLPGPASIGALSRNKFSLKALHLRKTDADDLSDLALKVQFHFRNIIKRVLRGDMDSAGHRLQKKIKAIFHVRGMIDG
jgi:hypothetical protein